MIFLSALVCVLQAGGQDAPTTAQAFCPDGKSILTGDGAGRVRLWDLATERVQASLPALPGPVRNLVVAPDGGLAAALSGGDTIAVVRLRGGGEPRLLKAGHAIRTAAFLPDGSALFTAGDGSRVECWDVETGVARWMADESSFPVRQVLASPDGETVTFRVTGGRLSVRSARDGASLFAPPGIAAPDVPLAYLPDSRLAVFRPEPVAWNLRTLAAGSPAPWLRVLVDAQGDVHRPMFLYALRREGSNDLWVPPSFPGADGDGVQALSPDARRLADPIGAGRFRLSPLPRPLPRGSRSVLSPGGRFMAVYGDKVPGIWVCSADDPSKRCAIPHPTSAQARVAVRDDDVLLVLEDGLRSEWTLRRRPDGLPEADKVTRTKAPEGVPLANTPDGRWSVLRSRAGALLKVEEDRRVETLAPDPGSVEEVAISSDGASVLALSAKDRALFRYTKGRMSSIDLSALEGPPYRLAASADGRRAVLRDGRNAAILFDLDRSTPLKRFEVFAGEAVSLAVLPDGDRVVIGTSDGRVVVHDARDGRDHALATLGGPVHALSTSSDGTVLLSASFSGPRIHRLER